MRCNPNPHFKLAMTLENNSDMSNACLDKKSEIEKEPGFKCLTKMAETMGIFPTHTIFGDDYNSQSTNSRND